MKFYCLLFCTTLFANCQTDAQIGKAVKETVEIFFKSASEKSLAEDIKRLSANSIKPKTEQEAFNFLNSNSVIIPDKNAIRLSEAKVFEYRNGTFIPGSKFNDYSKRDIIFFPSATEKESFIYMSDRDIFDIYVANPIAGFEDAKVLLKKKYGVTQFDVKNQKFVNAVNDILSRDVLVRNKFIGVKERNGNISYAIMEFQKVCKLPITGNLDKKTMNALNKLTSKGVQNTTEAELNMSRHAYRNAVAMKLINFDYAENTVVKIMEDGRLQAKYLEPKFSLFQKGKPDYSWKIPYLKFMADHKFIPADCLNPL